MKCVKQVHKYTLEISDAELWAILRGLDHAEDWKKNIIAEDETGEMEKLHGPDIPRITKLFDMFPTPSRPHDWEDLDRDND